MAVAMQALDFLNELLGQRCARFEDHATACMRRRGRTTIEAEPGDRFHEHTITIDEVGDPESAIAQEDRHFAPLAHTQDLALNEAAELAFNPPVQRCSSSDSPPPFLRSSQPRRMRQHIRWNVCCARLTVRIIDRLVDEVMKKL
jgi:hypothetical protein